MLRCRQGHTQPVERRVYAHWDASSWASRPNELGYDHHASREDSQNPMGWGSKARAACSQFDYKASPLTCFRLPHRGGQNRTELVRALHGSVESPSGFFHAPRVPPMRKLRAILQSQFVQASPHIGRDGGPIESKRMRDLLVRISSPANRAEKLRLKSRAASCSSTPEVAQ